MMSTKSTGILACLMLLFIATSEVHAFYKGAELWLGPRDLSHFHVVEFFFERLGKHFGANMLSIPVHVYVSDLSDTTPAITSNSPTNDEILSAIIRCKALGITPMVSVVFAVEGSSYVWPGMYGSDFTPTQYESFFTSYAAIIDQLAALAQSQGGVYLSIISDLMSAESKITQWKVLCQTIKTKYPNVKIGGLFSRLTFGWVEELHFVHLSTVVINFGSVTSYPPTVSEIKQAWGQSLISIKEVVDANPGLEIIQQVYFGSSTNTLHCPYCWGELSMEQQAEAFEGSFQALWEHREWIAGVIYGFENVWSMNNGGSCSPDMAVTGKTVETVIKSWYQPSDDSAPLCSQENIIPDYDNALVIYNGSLGNYSVDASSQYWALSVDEQYGMSGNSSLSFNLKSDGALVVSTTSVFDFGTYKFIDFWISSPDDLAPPLRILLKNGAAISPNRRLDSCRVVENGRIGPNWSHVTVDVNDILSPNQQKFWTSVSIEADARGVDALTYETGTIYIDELKLVPGKPAPPCSFVGCKSYTNRDSCLKNSSCGYCPETNECLEGDYFGAYEKFCRSWVREDIAGNKLQNATSFCEYHGSCFSCLTDPFCGWCSSTQNCLMGHVACPTSLTVGSCPDDAPKEPRTVDIAMEEDGNQTVSITILPHNLKTQLLSKPSIGRLGNDEIDYSVGDLVNGSVIYQGQKKSDSFQYAVYDPTDFHFMTVTINFNYPSEPELSTGTPLPEKSTGDDSTIVIVSTSVAGVFIIGAVIGAVTLRRYYRRKMILSKSLERPDETSSIYNPVPMESRYASTNANPFSGSPIGTPSGSREPMNGKKLGPNSFQIEHNQLQIGELVGSGGFGKVYAGKWRGGNVAIKVVLNVTEEDLVAFKAEAELMKNIRPHTNVVLFQGLCMLNEQLMIITEFMTGGNLKTWLSSAKRSELNKQLILKFYRGICAGMLHISSEGLVHRDLAARNILLSSSLEPKVSDFGLSRLVESTESGSRTNNNVGPLKWMAPECLMDNSYSVKSDVWAFGLTMWEIICQSDPYPNLTPPQVATQVGAGRLSLEFPDTYPDIKEVYNRCMQRRPEDRPDFQKLFDMLEGVKDK